MKVIAFYLPQFYEFEENNMWWGKGFTEWTNVKKAVPLYKGHYQPTIPLNNNWYALDNIDTMRWQVELAKNYGVYGFCFYHYWFGEDRQLMEKPVDMFLDHKELDFPFCLSWANHNWTRTWVGGEQDILMDVKYGNEEEWQKHFKYLLPFFTDRRYIQIEKKPVLVIYRPQDIPCFNEMKFYFNSEAMKNGLNGITFISQLCFDEKERKNLDYNINYEPNHVMDFYSKLSLRNASTVKAKAVVLKRKIRAVMGKILQKDEEEKLINIFNYDEMWNLILSIDENNRNTILGGFAKFDSSPRKGRNGVIYRGSSPEKFGKYLQKLIRKAQKYNNSEYIFLTAWNEWGEGAYLEPDEKYEFQYLDAVKQAVKNSEV